MTRTAHISADPPTELPDSVPETGRAVLRRIGGTPMLPLPGAPEGVELRGKAEWFNPGGSVKDRPARGIVREGFSTGELPGRRLLDASSGNTAIAYAMLGAALDFGVTLCVPANASRERLRTLRAYGAELVLTDPLESSDGAIRKAREMAREEPDRFWYADQYGNPENWRAHARTTAPEVWEQTGGRVTHLVAGIGTTGTLVGTARGLRERRPELTAVAVQPETGLHGIEGLKHLETAAVPGIWDESVADEARFVSTERARAETLRLARDAGIFAGISSGAACAAGREVARELEGGTVVVVLPDSGSRYLGEEWWEE